MKKLIVLILLTSIFAGVNSQIKALGTLQADSILMGTGYVNDVYYSFKNGVVKTEPRTNWDIAFATDLMSGSILGNMGNGVEVWTYPKSDTSGWSTIDTLGLVGWPKRYNSDKTWNDGAFNRGRNANPFNFGWGTYNNVSKNVTGDSLFILKRNNGTFMKIWIKEKNGFANTMTFKYANINGTNEKEKTISLTPYNNKNFIYFTFTNDTVVDREPVKGSWDIVFTRYITSVTLGSITQNYLVTGALHNTKITAAQQEVAKPDRDVFENWANLTFKSDIDLIGWDWKNIPIGPPVWIIYDTSLYFVKTNEGDMYKMYFTGFQGSSTGKIVFTKKILSLTGIAKLPALIAKVYPNPASEFVFIEIPESGEYFNIKLFDISGRLVLDNKIPHNQSMLNVSDLKNGLYLLMIENNGQRSSIKININK